MQSTTIKNDQIAAELLSQARRLVRLGGNLYRIRAYRHAAMTILGLREEVADVLARHGRKGLEALPGIGTHLAADIAEYLARGIWIGQDERRPRKAG